MWALRLDLSAKALPQWAQPKGFSPVWDRMWPCNNQGLEKALPQTVHLWLSEWVRTCMDKAGMLTYTFPQVGHFLASCESGLRWVCLCLDKLEDVAYCLPHSEQVYRDLSLRGADGFFLLRARPSPITKKEVVSPPLHDELETVDPQPVLLFDSSELVAADEESPTLSWRSFGMAFLKESDEQLPSWSSSSSSSSNAIHGVLPLPWWWWKWWWWWCSQVSTTVVASGTWSAPNSSEVWTSYK